MVVSTGGNWSAHCITRWPWFTVCFLVGKNVTPPGRRDSPLKSFFPYVRKQRRLIRVIMGSIQPVIPLATHKYKEVACPICHFMQDLRYAKNVLLSFVFSQLPSSFRPSRSWDGVFFCLYEMQPKAHEICADLWVSSWGYSNRPDVQSQHPGAGPMMAPPPGAQGGALPPPGYGAPPPGGGGQMGYK